MISKNKDSIAIISTDYWHYENPATRYPLFNNTEEAHIPIYDITNYPKVYDSIKYAIIRDVLEGNNDSLKDLIFSYDQSLLSITSNRARYSDIEKYYETLKKHIDDISYNIFIRIGNFPVHLIFKKIIGHELYVLPPLPDFTSKFHDEKKGYIDFLITAWNKIYNKDNKRNIDRYVFVLHEKDLGLEKNYKENVLSESDFNKEKYLKNYCTVDILKHLGEKYEIVVFQHDSSNSPNINREFLIKRIPQDSNLIEELERLIEYLKFPWKKLFELRNQILIKSFNKINIMNEWHELMSLLDKYMILFDNQNRDETSAIQKLRETNKDSDPKFIKSAIDDIFIKSHVSRIL